jgi:hypothetical protein
MDVRQVLDFLSFPLFPETPSFFVASSAICKKQLQTDFLAQVVPPLAAKVNICSFSDFVSWAAQVSHRRQKRECFVRRILSCLPTCSKLPVLIVCRVSVIKQASHRRGHECFARMQRLSCLTTRSQLLRREFASGL